MYRQIQCHLAHLLQTVARGFSGPPWLCTHCQPSQTLPLVHRLAEGRQPWSGAPVMPEAELGEHETGVWALAASDDGSTVVTGTDEGAVTAWDLRARRATWQARWAWGVSCMTFSSGTAASRAMSWTMLWTCNRAYPLRQPLGQ